MQSWSARLKSCIFILPHEAKSMLELFCHQSNMIGWRQNSFSSAFASWGKVGTAIWHFQNLTSQCLFCHQRQTHCWSYFASRRIWLVGLVKWQGRYGIHLDEHKVLVTWPKTPNLKPNPKPKLRLFYTQNLNRGVASREIWGGIMFDFRRMTLFCLEKRLSKHKMTIFSKHLKGACPLWPPLATPTNLNPTPKPKT